ncbi:MULTISPECIES: hypothetical protein [unclassified Aliiroseovarius]|uniref:hypothetical protein n=1 Tax=unclassified Aliiroseovarius TaxID=2623558 RepID=UPI0015692823|nr:MULTISPECIES: hypothetical protein [unclassified Aliiroseovarius]NRP28788.1 hypothetical protein [Aliiroseovarius sp. xm-m-314]NRP78430.1 hypothetical protein [Aliiroseovarius sp. xm-v-209]
MFGLGRKDKDGQQVRIEHRGTYTRASRTGGVALRAEKKLGPVNATANTSDGIRLSSRVAHGTHVALQNGKFRLIGRWNAGPLGFNLSKTGVSASVKNQAGTFNFLKPQYSSFKLGGVQLRGKKAAQIQIIYMSIMAAVFLAIFGVKLVVFLLWVLWLPFAFVVDLVVGFFRGVYSSQHTSELK